VSLQLFDVIDPYMCLYAIRRTAVCDAIPEPRECPPASRRWRVLAMAPQEPKGPQTGETGAQVFGWSGD